MISQRTRLGAAAASLLLLVGCANVSTTATKEAVATTVPEGRSASVRAASVFDAAAVHDVSVEVDAEEFRAMLQTYQDNADKQWITATVTIDGETFKQVGMRLKGNSSLRGVDEDSTPTELPWLIRLDKFVDGQSLDGYSELVIRSSSSQTSLNEAVALNLLAEAGLASEQAVAIAFSVNAEQARLRLMVQHLDEVWEAENFDTEGLLYKAESTGDYTYRGADPAAYEDVFDQETGQEDLTPLTDFLEFVNNSTDAEFAGQLDQYLEIDAFATYLAFEDLLGNFDDIDGPGNNSYLRYDAESERFTVVAWDHNLTFGISPGGGGPGGDRPDRGGVERRPDGVGPQGGGPGGGDNPLVTRFLANADFKAAYDDATTHLKETLIADGTASKVLADWVALLQTQAQGLVEMETVAAEAQQIEEFLAAQ